MQADGPLRRRLIAACLLLSVVIGGVFSAAAYVIVEAIEYELIETRLTRAGQAVARGIRDGAPIPQFIDLKFAIADQMPPEMRALPPGLHEIEVNGETLDVLIVDQHGTRFAVIDDISDFEELELISFSALGVAFLAGVLLALAIARASANRIIAPISILADAVQKDELARHPRLVAAPDEIGVLARAFQARASQLAEVLERERNFTADVSHELRTPLTIALGAAELLCARLALDHDLREVAERIRRATSGMSERVSALLQLARDPSRIELSTIPLRELLQREIERCRPLLAGKPVELSFHAPHEVWTRCNADLAAVAFSNLLRNACHFTEKGSVRVELAESSVTIEDTGPGVPSGIKGRLFEPFVRGSGAAATGSGLGLSIVKRIADHLGWLIQHEGSHHGGARFSLVFQPVLTHP